MAEDRSINIAVLAIGGQGGGVVAEWIVALAERGGYLAQYTSVPGVAQRTGATVYYLELFPGELARQRGKEPVLALMPVPGDVDIVIASELMEAGRAMQRGLVTPDRTTLIASTHRVYAISEKSAPGDGRSDGEQVLAAGEARALRPVWLDMAAAAQRGGSVISAAMFGALAGSCALPFPRSLFEEVIRAGGRAVEANLATFAIAHDDAAGSAPPPAERAPSLLVRPVAVVLPLLARLEALPFFAQDIAREGLRRVIDYQDIAYGSLYLDRLEAIAALDRAADGEHYHYGLTNEVARHLALWMSFEDTFRVADLKTRSARFARVRGEVGAAPGQIVEFAEFMHPRIEEICDSLPAPVARAILRSPLLMRGLGRLFRRGRTIRTSSLGGFLLLYLLAAGRRIRRTTLRYRRETAAIEAWLARIAAAAPAAYALAVEIAICQRLIKGYGDTHARGAAKFNRLMQACDQRSNTLDLAATLRKLREAALADDSGTALDRAIAELD